MFAHDLAVAGYEHHDEEKRGCGDSVYDGDEYEEFDWIDTGGVEGGPGDGPGDDEAIKDGRFADVL